MNRSEFHREPNGPRHIATWRWIGETRVAALPLLEVELQVAASEEPTDEMVALAERLLEYARWNSEYLIDLVHAHYRYAEREGWLPFWGVPSGIRRAAILEYVRSTSLVVDAQRVASVFIDPEWEQEHKLDLLFEGVITKIEGKSFRLSEGVLSFA